MTEKLAKVFLKDYQKPEFSIEHVFLDFDIQKDFTLVHSILNIQKLSKNADLKLNGENLELLNLSINDRPLSSKEYQRNEEFLVIFNPPSDFQLAITTKIFPDKNTALTGLYRSGNQYCTQCEAEGFRHITYFIDRPDVMSIYRTKISADKKNFPALLSNGNLIEQGDYPDGRHWALWEDPFKKPSYLFALVAGNFDLLQDNFKTRSGRNIVLRIYVEKGDLYKSHHAMQALKDAMHWDEINYEREYDLDLYQIVSIRDFNAGAMENKGLNIFNAQYILANPATATNDDYLNIESVIAHEYFHNWTGNRITCRDWFQLSLKEGLTIFRDQSFTEDTFSKAVARIRTVTNLRMRQFPEDSGPLAHPVQPNAYLDISNFYSSTVYNKGSEVIRMIRTLIGDKAFEEGMQWYFERYDGMAITIEDFIHAFEVVSHYDFTQFKHWYTHAGTPIVTVNDDYDEKTKVYQLHIEQKSPKIKNAKHEPFVIPIETALFDESGHPIPIDNHLLVLKDWKQTFTFKEIPNKPTPSLLRGFSAPVKLSYPYTSDQIRLLFLHDDDPFNRFDISQIYALQVIQNLMESTHPELPSNLILGFEELLNWSLEFQGSDKYFIAEMLTYPSEKLIAEKMEVIDYQAIHKARQFLIRDIASRSSTSLFAVYEANKLSSPPKSTDYSIQTMADRRLKNLALFYLMNTKKEKYIELGIKQFKEALSYNMTDTLGALRCLVNINTGIQQKALDEFYHQWKDFPEVLDKWLGQQALSILPDTLERVKNLTKHPKFSLKNPNQVYALIGTYSQQNLALFHDKEGKSYQFLGGIILELNKLNPIMAASMAKPFLDWRRFAPHQQKMMYHEIEHLLAQPNLSKALYEVLKSSVK